MDLKSKTSINSRRLLSFLLLSLALIVSLFAYLYFRNENHIRDFEIIIWIAMILFIAISMFTYLYLRRLSYNIDRLKQFANKASKGESIENLKPFLHDELGDISNQIIGLYRELQQTRGDLSREQQIVLEKEQESIRIKRDLTNNISHELKTPVSSIQGYLETVINNPDLSREEILFFIDKSYAQTNRLSFLLKDISTLTRMDEASHLIEKEKFDLREIISENIQNLKMRAKDKGFEIKSNIKAPLYMNGNSSLINSIFTNLIDNAINYSGGDTITINLLKETPTEIHLSFADNGTGVEEMHLNRIFERFYRVDKGRSRKLGGTGLGLAIVKNAIKLHGGYIKASLPAQGGLEFYIMFKK